MNNVTKKKYSKNNETFISGIIMDAILKKKNSLYFSNLIYPNINILLNSPLNLSDSSTPKSLEDETSCYEINKSDSFNTADLIRRLDSINSTDSNVSISTEISEVNSPKYYEYPNYVIKKGIINKINDDDSETITNTDIVLNINNKKINNNDDIKNENSILKSLSSKNIYDTESNDFLIISNLILISKLEPNQKLFISHNEITNEFCKIPFEIKIDNSYMPKISRWYYKQNRNETLLAIGKLFEISIEQFNLHKEINNNVEIKKYIELFKNSINGLNNLKITYSTDEETIKEIEIIINKLQNIIQNNFNYLKKI